MDFFTYKLNSYKEYTNQSYQQFARQLGVHYATLYNVMTNPQYPTIKRDILNNFYNLLEEIKSIKNVTTPWIDLFLPAIPKASHIIYLYHSETWATARCLEDIPPIMSNGRYEFIDNKKLSFLNHFDFPRFPISILPNSLSLYKQTESGWVQVHRPSEAVMKIDQYYIDARLTHTNVSIKHKTQLNLHY